MKLLGSTENKITKNKNDENVPHIEITDVLLFVMSIAKTFKSEFQEINVWFTDQNNSQPLEIAGRINLFLVIR